VGWLKCQQLGRVVEVPTAGLGVKMPGGSTSGTCWWCVGAWCGCRSEEQTRHWECWGKRSRLRLQIPGISVPSTRTTRGRWL